MTSILLTVTGAKALASVSGPLTSGMVGIPVTIQYDGVWDGLTKNLVCRCGQWGPDKGETRTVLGVGESATVAHEVMQAGMRLYLGIEGCSADGELVIPTTWADCGMIFHGANADADPSADPKLSVWAQLQAEIERVRQNPAAIEQLKAAVAAYLEENPISGSDLSQNVDLTGYATEQYVQEFAQPKGDYLTEHQDISGKLDASELPTAISTALAQAKASGDFDGTDGQDGAPGADGRDGADYVLTEADKAEIVAMVVESLGGNPVFGYVDADNNIIVSGNLADGTYSVKYEMEDGSTVDIGDLVLDTNVYYSVTNTLTNCVSSNSATQAVHGGSYSTTITAKSGYELKTVTVTMGGSPVAVSGENISIAEVTGNIVITAVAEVSGPAYTNRIPLSKDASGDAFNGGQGWKTGYRLGGDGTEKALSGIEVTGFIPIVYGDTIYMKNITDDGTHIMGVYNSSHAKIGTRTFTNIFGGAVSGQVLSMVVNDKWATETSVNSDVAYLRVSATEITADSIITVNEPIV